jgi:hypothetical protein
MKNSEFLHLLTDLLNIFDQVSVQAMVNEQTDQKYYRFRTSASVLFEDTLQKLLDLKALYTDFHFNIANKTVIMTYYPPTEEHTKCNLPSYCPGRKAKVGEEFKCQRFISQGYTCRPCYRDHVDCEVH